MNRRWILSELAFPDPLPLQTLKVVRNNKVPDILCYLCMLLTSLNKQHSPLAPVPQALDDQKVI
jgi:hypothetical protein